jgi:hypothetical protein
MACRSGPVQAGEDDGWRGYALPRMAARPAWQKPATTSIITFSKSENRVENSGDAEHAPKNNDVELTMTFLA